MQLRHCDPDLTCLAQRHTTRGRAQLLESLHQHPTPPQGQDTIGVFKLVSWISFPLWWPSDLTFPPPKATNVEVWESLTWDRVEVTSQTDATVSAFVLAWLVAQLNCCSSGFFSQDGVDSAVWHLNGNGVRLVA